MKRKNNNYYPNYFWPMFLVLLLIFFPPLIKKISFTLPSYLASFIGILAPDSITPAPIQPINILDNSYIGIFTTNPTAQLHIATDDFKINGGGSAVGDVLTAASADGLARWEESPVGTVSDIRFCIQINDHNCSQQDGSVQCTDWLSDGGGWSLWASDANTYDPDCARVKVETR